MDKIRYEVRINFNENAYRESSNNYQWCIYRYIYIDGDDVTTSEVIDSGYSHCINEAYKAAYSKLDEIGAIK